MVGERLVMKSGAERNRVDSLLKINELLTIF
jgi:hypothetical protein